MPLNEQQQNIVSAPLDVPVKVIAGAGTGKTQTLTERFLSIVIDHDVPPDRILAITFTEKAANEMSARIRGSLAKADRSVETALNIHTFHAFAGRLLREHADQADLAPDYLVIQDAQMTVLQRRLFRDATKGRLEDPDLSPVSLASLDIASLDSLNGLVFNVISSAKGRGWTPDRWALIAEEITTRFYDALPTQAEAEAMGHKPGVLTNEIFARLCVNRFDPVDWDTAVSKKDEPNVRRIYYSSLKPVIPNTDFDAQLTVEREQMRRLTRVIHAFFRTYNAELKKQNALDFDDLILQAVDMLAHHPELREKCRQRFRYILVDEFQDTSPIQMELIRLICRTAPCPADCEDTKCELRGQGRPQNVTIVGDKKQAIYAWRNARRDNLDKMIPCQQSNVVRPLVQNYRSAQAVIELANRIGACIEKDDPPLESPTLTIGTVHVAPPFVDGRARQNREMEARYIAERIQEYARTVSYRDIGVLLRQTKQFAPLRVAFRDRNIPYICEGAVGLLDEPCAKDVLACLRLAVSRDDDASWYRLLSRPPVSLSDRELADMRTRLITETGYTHPPFSQSVCAENARPEVRDLDTRVKCLVSSAASLPLAEFLSALPVISGLADAWDADDRGMWPQVQATLQAVAVEAEKLIPAASLEDFLDLLTVYMEDDKSMPYVASTEVGVRVMTIHKAKGLEFPIAIVPSVVQSNRHESGPTWDDDWGLLATFATADPIKKTIANWLRRKKELQADEEDRCWYVAATRAKRELVVTVSQKGKDKAPRWPLGISEDDVTPCRPEEWQTILNVRDREEPAEIGIPETHHALAFGTLRASFTTLKGFIFCPVSAYIDRVWKPPYFAEGTGEGRMNAIRAGDIFHAAALRYHGANTEGLPDSLFERGDSQLVRQGVKDRWNRFLESPCAQWTGVTAERRIRLRYQTANGPVTFNGFIDAMINEPDGWRLVDYKTGHLDEKSIADYALQLCLYRKALTAESLSVLNEGWIAHVEPGSFALIPVMLDEHESRLDKLIEDFASMFARRIMPDTPQGAPCEYCRHRQICPRRRDGAIS